MIPDDCRDCGACCVSLDGLSAAPLTRQDEASLPPYEARHYVRRDGIASASGAVGALHTVWRRPFAGLFADTLVCQCACLVLDSRATCSIYDARPSACRELERGGEECRVFRARLGLE